MTASIEAKLAVFTKALKLDIWMLSY